MPRYRYGRVETAPWIGGDTLAVTTRGGGSQLLNSRTGATRVLTDRVCSVVRWRRLALVYAGGGPAGLTCAGLDAYRLDGRRAFRIALGQVTEANVDDQHAYVRLAGRPPGCIQGVDLVERRVDDYGGCFVGDLEFVGRP